MDIRLELQQLNFEFCIIREVLIMLQFNTVDEVKGISTVKLRSIKEYLDSKGLELTYNIEEFSWCIKGDIKDTEEIIDKIQAITNPLVLSFD